LRRVDRELEALTVTLSGLLREELGEMETPLAAAAVVRDTLSAPGRALAIVDAHGETLAARWNGLDLPDVHSFTREAPPITTVQTPGGAWRVRTDRMTSGS